MKRRLHIVSLTVVAGSAALLLRAPGVSANGPKASGPKASASATTKTVGKPPTKSNQTGERRTMYCRGPFALKVAMGGLVASGKGSPAKKGAGPRGRDLKPSECSWSDASWGRSKASVLVPEFVMGHQGPSVIAACAHDSECIMRLTHVGDTSAKDGWGWANDNGSRVTTFPKNFVWYD